MHHRWMALCLATVMLGLSACGEQERSTGDSKPSQDQDADASWFTCFLAADGSFALDLGGDTGRKLLVRGNLWHDDPRAQADTLETLRAAMEVALRDPTLRAANGHSRAILRVDASPGAKWKYVQWILQTAVDPSVRMYGIDLREREDPTATRLDLSDGSEPTDHEQVEELELEEPSLDPSDKDTPEPDTAPSLASNGRLTIRFFRRDMLDVGRAYTHIRVGEGKLDLARGSRPGSPAYEASMRTVEQALEEALSVQSPSSILISAPPPKGPRVPYGDVLRVIRKIKSLGKVPIRLEGSAIPLRRR